MACLNAAVSHEIGLILWVINSRVANPVDRLIFRCILGAIRMELVETMETMDLISPTE